jgi:hypothetical protein
MKLSRRLLRYENDKRVKRGDFLSFLEHQSKRRLSEKRDLC